MPNPIDQKIIERLANDPSGEMKAYELEELLEKELTKEAEEIDPSLVSELLEALEPGDIPDGLKEKERRQKEACLQMRPVDMPAYRHSRRHRSGVRPHHRRSASLPLDVPA